MNTLEIPVFPEWFLHVFSDIQKYRCKHHNFNVNRENISYLKKYFILRQNGIKKKNHFCWDTHRCEPGPPGLKVREFELIFAPLKSLTVFVLQEKIS